MFAKEERFKMQQKTDLGPGTYDVCNIKFGAVPQSIRIAISSAVVRFMSFCFLLIPVPQYVFT